MTNVNVHCLANSQSLQLIESIRSGEKLTQFISPSDDESIFMNRAVTWSSFCDHGNKIENHTD